MDTTEKVSAVEIAGADQRNVNVSVVHEYSFKLFLDGQKLVTLLCSPTGLEELVAGYLFSQELIKRGRDIKEIKLDIEGKRADVISCVALSDQAPSTCKPAGTSGVREVRNYSGIINAIRPVESPFKIPAGRVFDLVAEFIHKSELFKDTGGVHSAAICSADGFVAYSDDIGRHNAVDKVIGECVLKDIPRDDKMLLTSGRISSEILLKAARAGIPIAVSKSAVTDGAISYAGQFGITLAGFVRDRKMTVYAVSERIMVEQSSPH